MGFARIRRDAGKLPLNRQETDREGRGVGGGCTALLPLWNVLHVWRVYNYATRECAEG